MRKMQLVQGFYEVVIAIASLVLGDNPNLTVEQISQESTSAPFYPSPWMNPGASGWEDAYVKAKDFVSQLTLLEKVNLTTGVG
jgi:hypothetical protein